MKLVTPALNVKESDGFKDDILDRQQFGETLRNIVQQSDGELVISLDGNWGEGKTTFVKMWQGLLLQRGIHSIYFDAFENDFADNAFISLARVINEFINDNKLKDFASEFVGKAKKVGARLLTTGAKLSVKLATLGAIEDEDYKEFKKDIASASSAFVGDLIEDKLNSHADDMDLVKNFKNTLSDLPDRLKIADIELVNLKRRKLKKLTLRL